VASGGGAESVDFIKKFLTARQMFLKSTFE
jgi:hypothetical protein